MNEDNTEGTNVGDFFGAGKGIEKLTGLIMHIFGKFTNSYFVRRDAAAKADELRLIGEAEAEVYERKALAEANRVRILSEGIRDAAPGTGGVTVTHDGSTITSLPVSPDDRLPSLSVQELIHRARSRELYQNVMRQQNIESVTAIAAEQLNGDPDISEEPVDPDWLSQFFKYIEDVSNEEMQTIWGKILAGEVKQPNTFTVRMLDTVKKLTRYEAQLFSELSSRVLSTPIQGFIFKLGENYELSVLEERALVEAGLFSAGESLLYSTANDSEVPVAHSLETRNYYIEHISNPGSKSVGAPICSLTSAGLQLAKFINAEEDIEYIGKVAEIIRNSGRKVKFGRISSRHDNGRVNMFHTFAGWQ